MNTQVSKIKPTTDPVSDADQSEIESLMSKSDVLPQIVVVPHSATDTKIEVNFNDEDDKCSEASSTNGTKCGRFLKSPKKPRIMISQASNGSR